MSTYDCKTETVQKIDITVSHKTKKPPMYKVILLNDDFTPMDFVVNILKSIFNKPSQEAVDLMLQIHNNGYGICGVYTNEIAETKIIEVMKRANQDQYPLQCTLEKE